MFGQSSLNLARDGREGKYARCKDFGFSISPEDNFIVTSPSYRIRIEGVGEANCTQGERALVAMERAQGMGHLKNLPRRLPVGCRRGGCGICRARILSGEYRKDNMSRAHVSLADEAEGIVLSCSIYPLSDLVLRFEAKTPQSSSIGTFPNTDSKNHKGET